MTRRQRRGGRLVRHVYVEVVVAGALAAVGGGVAAAAVAGEWAWLIASGTWAVTVAAIAVAKVHVPTRRRLADVVWTTTGAGAVVITAATSRAWGPTLVALAGAAASVGYGRWYTRQHRPTGRVAVGRPFPEVALERIDGTPTSSVELRGRPHVLVFYRGSWCPFCVAQIGALAERYRDLERRGVDVVLVSPQPAEDTARLARRFDVPMRFLVDRDGAAMRALDLVQEGGVPLAFSAGTDGDTVVPTVVVVDEAGVVVWVRHELDHRDRPDAATLIDVVDREALRAVRP